MEYIEENHTSCLMIFDTRKEKDVFTRFISSLLPSRNREEAIEKVYKKISDDITLLCKNRALYAAKPKSMARIQIILKGGQALKILSSNFISMVDTTPELRAHLKALNRDILQTPNSDLDLSVYVDPTLTNFDDVHNDVQKIVYNALVNYKIHIDNEKFIYTLINPIFDMDSDVGRVFLNELTNASGDRTSVVPKGLSDMASTVISSLPNGEVVKQKLQDVRLQTSPFYLTVNNRVAWRSLSWPMQDTAYQSEFSLLRLKLNMQTMRGIATENIPGELVDVSIPFKNDINLHRFFQKFWSGNSIIRVVNRLSQEVRIQNVSGIMEEFVNILMNIDEGGRYPWAVTKSGKRTSRLAFLCFLHFYISWMADNKVKAVQWHSLGIFRHLFDRQTYGILDDLQERQFATFRNDFDNQVLVYQEILKKIGTFTNRTNSNIDKKLKGIACRIHNECFMKVQNY